MNFERLTALFLELVEDRIGEVTTKALEKGIAKWIADPEVNGVYGLTFDGDCAVILYPADNDFEVADWYDDFCYYSPLSAALGI